MKDLQQIREFANSLEMTKGMQRNQTVHYHHTMTDFPIKRSGNFIQLDTANVKQSTISRIQVEMKIKNGKYNVEITPFQDNITTTNIERLFCRLSDPVLNNIDKLKSYPELQNTSRKNEKKNTL